MAGGAATAASGGSDTRAVAGFLPHLLAGLGGAGVTGRVSGVVSVGSSVLSGGITAGASRGAGFDGTFSAVLASRLAGLLQIVSGGTGLSGFVTRRAAVSDAAELVGA